MVLDFSEYKYDGVVKLLDCIKTVVDFILVVYPSSGIILKKELR